MATKNRNNIVQDVRFGGTYLTYPHKVDGSFDYNMGDLLFYDASAKCVKALDSDANAAFLVGVAARAAFLAPFTNQNVSGGIAKGYYPSALVGMGLIASFFSAAETFYDMDPVFFTTDAQTITKTDPGSGHPIGVVKMPSGAAAGSIAGGATVLVPVLVIPQLPVNSL